MIWFHLVVSLFLHTIYRTQLIFDYPAQIIENTIFTLDFIFDVLFTFDSTSDSTFLGLTLKTIKEAWELIEIICLGIKRDDTKKAMLRYKRVDK